MKIAVSYENGNIFQHFGHTKEFKIYDIKDNKIESEEVVFADGSGHGALADFLLLRNVNTVICGGIGGCAKTALDNAGIKLYGGVFGNADEAVKSFLAGTLQFNPDIKCTHHENKEHTCEKDCHKQ